MKAWLGTVFAIMVIVGWFLVALWMVLSLAQIAADKTTCLITTTQEVRCSP